MAKSVSDMRLSGGHPALDFVNTVDSRRGRWGPDLVTEFVDLVTFSQRTNLISAAAATTLRQAEDSSPGAAAKALAMAIAFRESLYRVLLEEDGGAIAPESDANVVKAAAIVARSHQAFEQLAGRWGWTIKVETPADLVYVLSSSAADLLVSRPNRRPVKGCKGDNCGWLFLDTSKGGRRIWCSEASCGVHSRVRKFRQN
ncbi:CGNR zinc finger domain-containing protein [Rhizobium sp. SIMBA_035]